MANIIEVAKELLESGKVSLVVGYRNSINNEAIPFFAENASMADKLILDNRCTQNLTHYLYKSEIESFKNVAVVVNARGVMTIIQLLSERQLKRITTTAIVFDEEKNISVLTTPEEFEAFLAAHPVSQRESDKEFIELINALPREKRWDFWVAKLSACVKCYACRASCPLCYCTRCAIEDNRPQWIKASSGGQGNMEWHISHAMHLVGRCTNCAECSRVCPVGIPTHIFTSMMNADMEEQFGVKPGTKVNPAFVLNTYKLEDKENFIL